MEDGQGSGGRSKSLQRNNCGVVTLFTGGRHRATAGTLLSHHKTILTEKNEQKMTNEANMLLKTKDRLYKRTQFCSQLIDYKYVVENTGALGK
jgi:hypothetical protein